MKFILKVMTLNSFNIAMQVSIKQCL